VDWLPDPSEGSLREALASAVPALASAEIQLQAEFNISNPEWCAGTVIVEGAFVAKVAWSEAAAIRVLREARVLAALAQAAPEIPIPRLVGMSSSPVGFVTRLVEGVPLADTERPPWPRTRVPLRRWLRLPRDALGLRQALRLRAFAAPVAQPPLRGRRSAQAETEARRVRSVIVTLRLYLADGREQLFSQEVDSTDESPFELLNRVSKEGRLPLGDRETCSVDEIIDARFEPSPAPQTAPSWNEAGQPLRDEDVAAALDENYDPPE
jgi:hypothetical protein